MQKGCGWWYEWFNIHDDDVPESNDVNDVVLDGNYILRRQGLSYLWWFDLKLSSSWFDSFSYCMLNMCRMIASILYGHGSIFISSKCLYMFIFSMSDMALSMIYDKVVMINLMIKNVLSSTVWYWWRWDDQFDDDMYVCCWWRQHWSRLSDINIKWHRFL